MSELIYREQVLWNKMQLDSALVEESDEPLYPSILLTHINESLGDNQINKHFDSNVLYHGTEIIQFLKLVDPTFVTRCVAAQSQAIETGTWSDTVDFYFPAFVEDYSFGFRFMFYSTNEINFESAINTRDKEHTNEFFGGAGRLFTQNPLTIGETPDAYDLFNTSNSFEIYLCINPYNDDSDNLTVLMRLITEPSDLTEKRYFLRGNSSGVYADDQKITTYDILTRVFRNHLQKSLTKVPVGGYEYIGENENDSIGQPDTPSTSILSGMHNMYLLDAAELLAVSKALWSPDFYDNLLKLFNDPMESIVSLAMCPTLPDTYSIKSPIVVGNVELKYTPVTQLEPITCTAFRLSNQYKTLEFGEIILYEDLKNYLDYDCKVEIFLPFIGIKSLNTADVMNARLDLQYNVDFFTGDCVASLHCYRPSGVLDSTLYQWDGNILCNVPVSASNYSQTIMTGINTVVGLAGAKSVSSAISSATGMLGAMKPDIDRGGSMGSTKGSLGIFTPYLIVTQPIEDKPDNYWNLKGIPDNTRLSLERGIGFVTADSIHIKGISATQEEKVELESLFKSGVIL